MSRVAEQRCWCGSAAFEIFSPEYLICAQCGSLVSVKRATSKSSVNDEANDLYGLNYFDEHAHSMGHPGLVDRARLDLSERCPFWLKALLPFCPPPARTLELGCANGSFVGLLSAAGYDASGMDLSPAVTAFVHEAFEVPILTGPLETQDLKSEAFDVVILMDVLEHLPQPVESLETIAEILRPAGLLMIQTPAFDPTYRYQTLLEEKHPFLAQLKADEHLYLFHRESVKQLLKSVGFGHFAFLPAIFDHYDMFFFASRVEMVARDESTWRDALRRTRSGRVVEALIDLHGLARSYRAAMTDHEVLEIELARAAERATEVEPQSNVSISRGVIARAVASIRQNVEMQQHIEGIEADRAARLRVIEEQQGELARLRQHIDEIEADRAARLAVIETQQAEFARMQQRIESLRHIAAEHETLSRRLGPIKRLLVRKPRSSE
jgi:2-polyprenyl-3-methyl-5-hydroxy-6-metoxy-1,4-benzoquinol methylase